MRRARPEDAPILSALAKEAKRSWGYPGEWMKAWEPMLTLSPEYITLHPTFLATRDQSILGFAVVEVEDQVAKLEHLWVRPGEMRKGTGRALFHRCEQETTDRGAKVLKIESDPHAEGFYLRMGAVKYGAVRGDRDGVKRHLPLLRKPLAVEK